MLLPAGTLQNAQVPYLNRAPNTLRLSEYFTGQPLHWLKYPGSQTFPLDPSLFNFQVGGKGSNNEENVVFFWMIFKLQSMTVDPPASLSKILTKPFLHFSIIRDETMRNIEKSLFSGNSLSTLCRDTYCLRRLWTSNSRRRSCALYLLTRDRLFQAWKSTKVFMENRAASAPAGGAVKYRVDYLYLLLNVPNPNSKTNSSNCFSMVLKVG